MLPTVRAQCSPTLLLLTKISHISHLRLRPARLENLISSPIPRSRHGRCDLRGLSCDSTWISRTWFVCTALEVNPQSKSNSAPHRYRRPNLDAGRSSHSPSTRTYPHLEHILSVEVQCRILLDPSISSCCPPRCRVQFPSGNCVCRHDCTGMFFDRLSCRESR
jgi:hypothetical protein